MRVVLLAVLLAGCAQVPVPHDVKVAVGVDCHAKKVDKPDFAADHLQKGTDIFTQSKTLLAERRQRIDYEKELEAANAACQ